MIKYVLGITIVSINNLEETIEKSSLNRIIEEEQRLIAQIIDEHRINA